MSDILHTETIVRDGLTFKVTHEYDCDADAPWTDDGHGPVSAYERRSKRPGELVIHSERRGEGRYYDFAEACRLARKEGWGSYSAALGQTMTHREFAANQAWEDYENLRAWANSEWCYIGVVVTLLDIEGNETDATQSLWRVDDNGDYAATVASDLIGQCIADIADRLHSEWPGHGAVLERAVYTSGACAWRVV